MYQSNRPDLATLLFAPEEPNSDTDPSKLLQHDLSEREPALLESAAPHLQNSLRGALAYNRLNSALETARTGVIIVGVIGRLTLVSDFARTLLDNYFAGEAVEAELPVALSNWLQDLTVEMHDAELGTSPAPLRIERELGTLTIRWMENSLSDEQTLLLEEKRFVSNAAFKNLNLTARESDILMWIMKGKSDSDISTLCSISIRTVHKHVENIYRKLGVETRTAAMLRAFEHI